MVPKPLTIRHRGRQWSRPCCCPHGRHLFPCWCFAQWHTTIRLAWQGAKCDGRQDTKNGQKAAVASPCLQRVIRQNRASGCMILERMGARFGALFWRISGHLEGNQKSPRGLLAGDKRNQLEKKKQSQWRRRALERLYQNRRIAFV
jgi:hypothetical protein